MLTDLILKSYANRRFFHNITEKNGSYVDNEAILNNICFDIFGFLWHRCIGLKLTLQ